MSLWYKSSSVAPKSIPWAFQHFAQENFTEFLSVFFLLPVLVDSGLHLEYILRDTNATLRGDLAVDELILVRVIILITPIEGLLIDRGGHIDCGYCVERPELVRLAASVKGSLQPT